MLNANDDNYLILGLDLAALSKMDPEERGPVIRKAYRQSILRAHPDKGGSKYAFQRVNDAYEKIMGLYNQPNSRHQEPPFLGVSPEMFDLRTVLFMKDFCHDILKNFPADTNVFRANVDAYFRALHRFSDAVDTQNVAAKSVEQLQQLPENIDESHRRQWRMVMLKLFAEEYLPDHCYREMLVFGLSREFMTWRKLLIPVKWLTAAVFSMSIPLDGGWQYLMASYLNISKRNYEFLKNQYQSFKAGETVDYVAAVLRVLGLLALSIVSIPSLLSLNLLAMVASVLAEVALILATPSNSLRDLQQLAYQHSKVSTILLSVLSLLTVSVALSIQFAPYTLMSLIGFNSVQLSAFVLGGIDIAFAIAMGYLLLQYSKLFAGFMFLQSAFNIAMWLFQTNAMLLGYMPLVTNPVGFGFWVGSCVFQLKVLSMLQDLKKHQEAELSRFPFPTEPLTAEIRDTMNKFLPSTFWSNDLFHTGDPDKTRSLQPAERSGFVYHAKSFFGFYSNQTIQDMHQENLSRPSSSHPAEEQMSTAASDQLLTISHR